MTVNPLVNTNLGIGGIPSGAPGVVAPQNYVAQQQSGGGGGTSRRSPHTRHLPPPPRRMPVSQHKGPWVDRHPRITFYL